MKLAALTFVAAWAGMAAAAGVRVENQNLLKELSAQEQSILSRQGMVARLTYETQIHKVYVHADELDLPVLVTTDPVLHAFHILYDFSLRTAELDHFYPEMESVLGAMLEFELARHADEDSPPVKQALLDNVAYLGVPLSLLRADFAVPAGVAERVAAERALVDGGTPAVSVVMGYLEDFSQYKPRGHYTRNESFRRYFKAMMYVGRMTFRLPPDGDVGIARRAVLLAEALEDATVDSSSTAKALWQRVYDATSYMVGESDDILPGQYYELAQRLAGGVPLHQWLAVDSNVLSYCESAKALPRPRILSDIAAGGMPAGMRLMGQRYVPDGGVFQALTHPNVPDRFKPMGLDLMAVLGSARARDYLVSLYRQDAYRGYLARLDSIRGVFLGFDSADWNRNAYNGWLHALQLNLQPVQPKSRRPLLARFVCSQAYPDKTLVTSLGSWAQLRHDTILYVKQAACTGGCILEERPRIVAYVEPKPDVFRRVERLATELRDTSRTKTVFHAEVDRKLLRLAGLAGRLGRIADGELHGFELADSDAAFCKGLGITLESIVTFSDSFAQAYSAEEVQKAPPKQVESAGPGRDTLSGDVRAVVARAARVSRGRQYNEDLRMATVADVHTDLNSGLVLEEAVGDPCKLYAVIPCRGSSYLAVGACYSYYEFTKPMSERMTDAEWQQLRPKPPMPEWTGSFIAR